MAFLAPALLFFAAFAQDSDPEQLKKEVDRLKAYNEVLLRQLKELSEKMSQLEAEKAPLVPQELLRQEQRLQAVRSAQLEAQELLRTRGLKAAVTAPTPAPQTSTEGKVTAIANEIGLVVLSLGLDDGIKEGDEVTILRGTEVVGKVQVDRTDRKWSAGKLIDKKSDPRVGDSISKQRWILYNVAPVIKAPAPAPSRTEELRSIRKELDDVCAQVRFLSDKVIPSWQHEGFALEEASEPVRSQLKIAQGVVVRQVREGSPAAKFGFKPYDVVPQLSEDQVLQAVKEGKPVTIYRQGTLETLQGVRSR